MAMTHPFQAQSQPGRKRRVEDERTFQLLFLLSFPIFLALALTARAHPASKSGGDEPGSHRGSVLSEAAAAARSTIAIALTD